MRTYVYRRLGVKQTHTDLVILQVRIFPLENTSTISKFSIISMFTKSFDLLLILFFSGKYSQQASEYELQPHGQPVSIDV